MCIQHYCRYSCGCEVNTEFAQCNAGRRLSQQPYVLVRTDSNSTSGGSSPTDPKPQFRGPTTVTAAYAHAHARSQSLSSARCAPVREGTALHKPCPSHSSSPSTLAFSFPCRSHEDDAQHSD